MTALAGAQQAPQGVTLFRHLNLGIFGAASGNDCWGYVSPSGREYAVVGLSNQVAFVEVTDPANPVFFASIPHTSSLWGDIKVYQHYAYAVTEASGTGIQVIDMSQIDLHQVTLVRTISSPGRTHNLALDPVSGFLYTCGSRDGTGTTMCFSLANPANPVRVGKDSMTTIYQHDANVVTYTTGPLAGKQIWYGCSEDRGVDIYDMTDKNNPFRIKRVTYPSMGYCHQAWLSEDRKYLYVDDEFDEDDLGVNTRSLIFNVEDPANAFFVGTFSSDRPSVDHNQYVSDGFLFQANYHSGLRIFDGTNPTSPVQTGWYDTYPGDDGRGYDGAWSNYPFFPSGTVIVSDIDGGLFVLDATEATTRFKAPAEMSTLAGSLVSGGLADLAASDDVKVVLKSGLQVTANAPSMQLTVSTTAFDTSPLKIRMLVESSSNFAGMNQELALFNWNTASYEVVDTDAVGTTETSVLTGVTGAVSRFVNPTTRRIEARISWRATGISPIARRVEVDQVQFQITR